MTIKHIIGITISIFVILLSLGVMVAACHQDKGHTPLSKKFLHRTTENISDNETVEVYVDLTNDNICYFYYFADQKDAVALACVPKPASIF